ncbi:hypothetical protein GGR55DRAFT_683697 [Xylaria sp. FL0064]|nr:hypothetical protein GGR55DRAFT_683697 [Xylaria sp. FL0064]
MDEEDLFEDDGAQNEQPDLQVLWANFERMCIAILPNFLEDTQKPLRRRIALKFLTAAYERLADLESCLALLQRVYEALEFYEETERFIETCRSAFFILTRHVKMMRMFLCQVQMLCDEKVVLRRIDKVIFDVQFYIDLLGDLTRRAMADLRAMRREMDDEDEGEPELELAGWRMELGRWEFEIPRVLMRLLVIPWPVYAKQPHGRQRLSCDLQWGREGKRRLKSNRVRSYTMTTEV